MQRYWSIAVIVLALMASDQASACFVPADLDLNYVQKADAVVVGKVSNYRIVAETQAVPDHARFEVEVEEVLAGSAPERLSLIWQNSTFGEPSGLPPGPFLVAVRKIPESWPTALQGSGLMTVLQEPCAPAILFEVSSEGAKSARRILGTPKP